jgi:hypothetical protein
MGPGAGLEAVEKSLFLLSGIEAKFLSCRYCGLVTILTELSRVCFHFYWMLKLFHLVKLRQM